MLTVFDVFRGTGVGLVRTGGPAGKIVEEIRRETKETIKSLAGLI